MEFLQLLEGRSMTGITDILDSGVTVYKENLSKVITDLPFDLEGIASVFIPVVLVVLSIVVIYDLFVTASYSSTSRAVKFTPKLLKAVNFVYGMKDQYALAETMSSRSMEGGWGPMLTLLDLGLAKYGHHY